MPCAKEATSKVLYVLDPDLPRLAVEAAIDIDNLLSNRSNELGAIRDLAERLNNSIEINATGHHSLMDPATLSVLGEAVAGTAKTHYVEKIENLLVKAAEIGAELSGEDLAKNPENLKLARDFCESLALAVVAYHKSIRDLRPMHPFKR